MNKNIYISILKSFIATLQSNPDYYTLNHLTTSTPEMTNEEFHHLASIYKDDANIKQLYSRISDILEMRIVSNTNDAKLDKELAKMMLRSFYKWDKKDESDIIPTVRMGTITYDTSTLKFNIGCNA